MWSDWVVGVIAGIGEPLNVISIDTHWAWSNAETAPYDLMRWNNPQNTTEPWPRAHDSGAQPGAHDVKIYATLQDGIDATVYTLLNEPYYGAIVANLRAGRPRQQWGVYSAAGAQLHAWGTGTNWLQAIYGPAPDILEEEDMTPEQSNKLDTIFTVVSQLGSYPVGKAALDTAAALPGIQAKLDMIIKSGGLTSLQAQQLVDIMNKLTNLTLKAT